MLEHFIEEQEIEMIVWPCGGETTIGKFGVVSIKVIFEQGQMALVPWAIALFENGEVKKYNLAAVSSVLLKKRSGKD